MVEALQHDGVGGRHDRLLAALRAAADRAAATSGVEVVDVSVRGSSRRRAVRVDIDRPGPAGVTIDDCERVSAELGNILEGDDVLDDSFVLEVSSPGLDRPIRSDDDVRRNVGRVVEVVAADESGERRVVGVLRGRTADTVLIENDAGETVRVPRDAVREVRQHVGF